MGQTVKAPCEAGERFGIRDWVINDIYRITSRDGSEQIHISAKPKERQDALGSHAMSEAYLDKYNGETK